jgi:hypothetical protein
MSWIGELNIVVREERIVQGEGQCECKDQRLSDLKSLVTVRERSLKKLSTRECPVEQIHFLLQHVYTWALDQFKTRINAHKKSRNKDGS